MKIKTRPDVFIITTMALVIGISVLLPGESQDSSNKVVQEEVILEEEPPSSSLPALIEDVVPEENDSFYTQEELYCLALNTYYEARNQSKAGQIATILVVMNRSKSSEFPTDICDVVTQGPTYENWKGNLLPVRDQCQFSWYCDGMSDVPNETEKFEQIKNMVYNLSYYDIIDFTEGSTHYHADYVNPDWKHDYKRVVQIDQHIFYKNHNE